MCNKSERQIKVTFCKGVRFGGGVPKKKITFKGISFKNAEQIKVTFCIGVRFEGGGVPKKRSLLLHT